MKGQELQRVGGKNEVVAEIAHTFIHIMVLYSQSIYLSFSSCWHHVSLHILAKLTWMGRLVKLTTMW